MKKAIRCTTAGFLVVLSLLFTVISGEYAALPDQFHVTRGDTFSLPGSANDAVSVDASAAQRVGVQDNYEVNISLFGIIPIKTVQVEVVEKQYVVPCGVPFGIKMFTEGVVVVGLSDVDGENGLCNPGRDAGIKLGDVILSIDGVEVSSNDQVAEIITASGGKDIAVTLRRKNMTFTVAVSPARTTDGQFKAGLWVRDSSAGIGTLTFYNPDNQTFGGLGHPICDVDTGEILPLNTGEVGSVQIIGAVKGVSGSAGELRGRFINGSIQGELTANTEIGVYGSMELCPVDGDLLQVATKQQVQTGPATILTTVEGSEPQEYEIEIEKITLGDDAKTRNMVIHITDPALIEKTGGIVQGMSGSPIIQNGMFVGAVTHVFVNDPTRGYAIFGETMLEGSINTVCSTK